MRRRAAIPKKYEHIDFTPPKAVADAAKKGLELRQKASPSNRGGLTVSEASEEGIGSGVQRAVNLKNRDTISPEVIKKMRGFLSRHRKNKSIAPENKDTPWNDKGYVSWLLWGGDPAVSWVDKIISQMEAADEKGKQSKQAYSSDVQETGGIKTLPQGRWEIVGWSELSDYMKGAVWDVYDLSYGSIGKHIPDMAAFGKKYKFLYLIDIDDDILPDAFIAYKETHAGFKITLGGTDGTRIAKKAMIQKMKELIRQPGWYAEGSHKVAEILESAGMRPIDDEEVVRKTLRGKDIEWLGDGKYSRQLGTSSISAAKSLYGTPRVAMQVRVARRYRTAEGENEPTNPKLWAKVQALAKGEQASMTHGGKTVNGPNDGKGFTVFPSAYANGWASKVYKDLGGKWKKKASITEAWDPTGSRTARGKAKKDVGHGGLDEWFSGHGGAKGEGEDATWGDWVSISPVTKTLPSGKKVEKGDIVGECGISDDPDWKEITRGGEDPLKCMPRQKAYDMPKAERAEKAKAKQRAEDADSSRGKKPTMTPTFQKEKGKKKASEPVDTCGIEKSATVQRIQMKREASARLRAAWRGNRG